MTQGKWQVVNPDGAMRVVVTRDLPGRLWLDNLVGAGCRVEISGTSRGLATDEIIAAMGTHCDGVIGQLTEHWGRDLFTALKKAGGRAYSNYAVGYNNVDLAAATAQGLPVGNTPGVLTETTAELAVALTMAAARRLGEAERYIRAGRFTAWLPSGFLGHLLWRKTLGVLGAGRIGAAYARMMVQGHQMDLVYFNRHRNQILEAEVEAFADYLRSRGGQPVACRRVESLEALLRRADVVSLHTVLDDTTHHMIDAKRLALMKDNAVLINTSRGPVIDEAALVAHCQTHPGFRAGLDVFENEPALSLGLDRLDNVVIVPHIGSASRYAREGMATLAALNVAAILKGYPVWNRPDVTPFMSPQPPPPPAAPSILNADALGLARYV